MRNRVLLALALVAAAVIAPAGAAHAQCGPAKSTGEALTLTEVAFVGRVVDRSNLDRTAVMEVLEVWKGKTLPPTVTVNGGPEDPQQFTSIDRRYLLGQIYLVMPANTRAPFLDSMCSGTQLWSTPDGTIPEEFQLATGNIEPIPVMVGASSDGDGSTSWLIDNLGVGLLVLALAVGVVFSVKAISTKPGAKMPPGRGPSPAGRVGDRSASPASAFKKRRRWPSFSMPTVFESRRSRLERFRRSGKRGRRSHGLFPSEHLERAVNVNVTTPPKRKNHYTSGRRSAP